NKADTDGDGLSDGVEVLTGSYDSPCPNGGCTDADPNRAGRQTDPLNPDSDGDGLCDGNATVANVGTGSEDVNLNGAVGPPQHQTDPTNPDTDSGGEADGSERQHGREPVHTPADDNGAQDDDDHDGLTNAEEGVIGTDPENPDT